MKTIICGAGEVGKSIAEKLSKEGLEVTVVDESKDQLKKISETLDVKTIQGASSLPSILSSAGASECDILIAVTKSDENNMISCQIGYSLFFIGYIRWIPGTFGSIFSLIIIIFLHNIVNKNEFIILFFCILLMATICIKIYSKSVNKDDAKEIIIDEFLGIYLIVIFSYDFKIFNNEFVNLLLILLFFRIFDILKPFPANWIDKNLKNSYGVILDDIVAGIYTIITLTLINAFV